LQLFPQKTFPLISFEQLCGSQSAIRKEISMLKPDKEIKRFSLLKTVGAGALVTAGVMGGLFLLTEILCIF
jgi:hypothetical protein